MGEAEKILLIILFSSFIGMCIVTYRNVAILLFESGDEYKVSFLLKPYQTDILKGIAIIAIFISHIATHSSFYLHNSGEEGYLLKFILYFLVTLGDIGVALFFFFSGYGNYLSLEKGSGKDFYWKWFMKRVKKCLITFFISYLIVYLMRMINGEILRKEQVISDCFSITMPNTETWYLKIQLLFYIITFLCALVWRRKGYLKVIALISFVYSFGMYITGMKSFWWQTALCYVLGMYFVENREKLESIFIRKTRERVIMLLLLIPCIYLIGNHVFYTNYVVRIIMFLLLTISIICVTSISSLQNGVLTKILGNAGQNSLEIYLIHAGITSMIFVQYGITAKKIVWFIICTIVGVVLVKIIKRIFNV